MTKDTALGCRDKRIARPGYLVDRRNGLRAISQRRNGLRATNPVDSFNPRQSGRQQHQRVDLAGGCGCANNQTLNTRDLRGNGIHQHRGRIACQPPRHIQPRCRHRPPTPAQFGARVINPAHVLRALAVMIGANARRRQFQRGTLLVGNTGAFGIDFVTGKRKRVRCQVQLVEFRCQLDDGCIATFAHIRDDGGNSVIHIDGLFAFCAQQAAKGRFKIRIAAVQKHRHQVSLSNGWRGALPDGAR